MRVQQEQTKPLLRKPYLKYGQCFAMAGYFVQLGAVLAAKYREHLDAFGHSFLGLRGEAGAVARFFSEAIEIERVLLKDPMSFTDYVTAEQIKRFEYSGEPERFFLEFGMQKIRSATAVEMAWQFAEHGAILGAMRPGMTRAMFEHTHKPRDRACWDRTRAAGLDIPAEQECVIYEEVEKDEDELFRAYCRECCPSLYAILAR